MDGTESGPEPGREHQHEIERYQQRLERALSGRGVDRQHTIHRVVQRGRRQTDVRDVLTFAFGHLPEAVALFFSKRQRDALVGAERSQRPPRRAPHGEDDHGAT